MMFLYLVKVVDSNAENDFMSETASFRCTMSVVCVGCCRLVCMSYCFFILATFFICFEFPFSNLAKFQTKFLFFTSLQKKVCTLA